MLIFFLFTSCFVIKVYENDEEEKTLIKPGQFRKEMIRSGKVIELPDGEKSELLFYGKTNFPVDRFFLQDSIVFRSNDTIPAK